MSAQPKIATAPPAKGKPVTLSSLGEKKALGEPIAMVTAYDYPSAQVAEEAGVDVVLVGDSAAMTVLGYPEHGARLRRRDADAGRGGSARAEDPVARGRSALRLLRGLGRAGHRHGAAVREGGRL